MDATQQENRKCGHGPPPRMSSATSCQGTNRAERSNARSDGVRPSLFSWCRLAPAATRKSTMRSAPRWAAMWECRVARCGEGPVNSRAGVPESPDRSEPDFLVESSTGAEPRHHHQWSGTIVQCQIRIASVLHKQPNRIHVRRTDGPVQRRRSGRDVDIALGLAWGIALRVHLIRVGAPGEKHLDHVGAAELLRPRSGGAGRLVFAGVLRVSTAEYREPSLTSAPRSIISAAKSQ